jgi:hypothetical protein
VPNSREGGPAKWLNNKNLENHLCDFEPEGREFESLRARQSINYLPLIGNAQLTKRSENVAFSATFLPRGATFRLGTSGCRSMRVATELARDNRGSLGPFPMSSEVRGVVRIGAFARLQDFSAPILKGIVSLGSQGTTVTSTRVA